MFDGVDQPTDDKIVECILDFIVCGNYSIYLFFYLIDTRMTIISFFFFLGDLYITKWSFQTQII